MRAIQFDDAQGMLLRISGQFFRDKWPIESVRERLTRDDGHDLALWNEMVDLGWNGMVIPEEYGGTGLGMTELVTLVEPMGRFLFASPFFSTQLAIRALLDGGSEAQRSAVAAEARRGRGRHRRPHRGRRLLGSGGRSSKRDRGRLASVASR